MTKHFHIKILLGISLLALLLTGMPLSPDKIPTHPVIFRVKTSRKVVALTYDDGPHPKYTPQILNILKKHNIKATFFMIGTRVEKYPNIVKTVLKDGHVVANHTYTHPRCFYLEEPTKMDFELDSCEAAILKMGTKPNHLFRPPRGKMSEPAFSVVKNNNYRIVLWSVCGDHHDAPTPRLMANRVLKVITPGSIILLHDGTFDSRWKDVAATKLIIEALKKKGYTFVTVPELLAMKS